MLLPYWDTIETWNSFFSHPFWENGVSFF